MKRDAFELPDDDHEAANILIASSGPHGSLSKENSEKN
jgi:hypothetical protein